MGSQSVAMLVLHDTMSISRNHLIHMRGRHLVVNMLDGILLLPTNTRPTFSLWFVLLSNSPPLTTCVNSSEFRWSHLTFAPTYREQCQRALLIRVRPTRRN